MNIINPKCSTEILACVPVCVHVCVHMCVRIYVYLYMRIRVCVGAYISVSVWAAWPCVCGVHVRACLH